MRKSILHEPASPGDSKSRLTLNKKWPSARTVLAGRKRIFRSKPIEIVQRLLHPDQHVRAAVGYGFAQRLKFCVCALHSLELGSFHQTAEGAFNARERSIKKFLDSIVEADFSLFQRTISHGSRPLR